MDTHRFTHCICTACFYNITKLPLIAENFDSAVALANDRSINHRLHAITESTTDHSMVECDGSERTLKVTQLQAPHELAAPHQVGMPGAPSSPALSTSRGYAASESKAAPKAFAE